MTSKIGTAAPEAVAGRDAVVVTPGLLQWWAWLSAGVWIGMMGMALAILGAVR